MKKLFTLSFGMLMAIISFARQPQVTVTVYNASNNNIDYDVSIDGRMYQGNSTVISDLYQGQHTLQVYEVRGNGFFGIGKKRTLISTQQFQLRNNDLQIDVDRYGQARINEYGNNDGGWNNNGGRNNNGGYNNRNCDDKRYDHSNGNWNNGRGNKYGHYKKHKHGKGNGKWDDDDRRRRDDDDDDNR